MPLYTLIIYDYTVRFVGDAHRKRTSRRRALPIQSEVAGDYCLTSVEQHQSATYILVALERCCSSEVNFQWSKPLRGGEFLPVNAGSRSLEVPLIEVRQYSQTLNLNLNLQSHTEFCDLSQIIRRTPPINRYNFYFEDWDRDGCGDA